MYLSHMEIQGKVEFYTLSGIKCFLPKNSLTSSNLEKIKDKIMKKSLSVLPILAVLLVLTCVRFVQSTYAQEADSEKKTVKILTIGNSFTDSLRTYFPVVVESANCRLIINYCNYPGCSLEQHWKKLADVNSLPQDYDYITIQQASHYSWKYETYQPYADNIIAFLKEKCPSAEIVIQQTWAYHPAEKRLVSWGFSQREMYEKLTKSYDALAKKHNLRVIPTGDAVQLARETQPGGYNPENKDRIFTRDGFHLNKRGEYLQACVWFGMLFNEPISSIAYQPKELTTEDAAFLRDTAQKAIDARK